MAGKSPDAAEDLGRLLGEVEDFAKRLLDKVGGVPIFGGTIDTDGTVGLAMNGNDVRGVPGENQVAYVLSLLRAEAAGGKLRAGCIVCGIRVSDGAGRSLNAIMSSMHHRAGPCVDVILPYVRGQSGAVDYGEHVTREGSYRIFP